MTQTPKRIVTSATVKQSLVTSAWDVRNGSAKSVTRFGHRSPTIRTPTDITPETRGSAPAGHKVSGCNRSSQRHFRRHPAGKRHEPLIVSPQSWSSRGPRLSSCHACLRAHPRPSDSVSVRGLRCLLAGPAAAGLLAERHFAEAVAALEEYGECQELEGLEAELERISSEIAPP